MDKKRKQILIYIIKLIISSALLYLILKDVNINEILNAIKKSHYTILIFAFCLHFFGLSISSLRWKTLLETQGVNSNILYLIKSHLVGMFFNNFLPSTVGGDVSRAYDSYKLGKNKADAVSVIFLDRFLGLFALLLFAGVAVLFIENLSADLPFVQKYLSLFIVIALFILWLIFFSNRKMFSWIEGIRHPLAQKIIKKIFKILDSIWAFRNHKQKLILCILYSIILQLLVVLYYFLISSALDFNVGFQYFLIIIPLSVFIMMLPISINGIGLRENIYFLFFSNFLVPQASVIAFAWIELGMIIVQGIIGGIIYFLRKQ